MQLAVLSVPERLGSSHAEAGTMCKRVQCEQCHKATFSGCGKHVEQVLRGVTEADRCMCKRMNMPASAAFHRSTSSAQALALGTGIG
jgi:hypothetical protein